MRRPSHVTLDDLARRLHVSKVTVSKALRDQPDIAPETKARVKKLAEESNYTPNYIARNLSSRKSNTIGVVLPKVAHFSSFVIETVYDAAFKHDDEIILAVSQENAGREIRPLKFSWPCAWAVYWFRFLRKQKTRPSLMPPRKKHIPLVFFHRVIDDIRPQQCNR